MEKKPDVYEPKALHYALVFPLYVFVILLTATLRFKYSDKTKQRCTNPSRLLGVAWHRHILLVAKAKTYFRKKLTMSGLVSASKDAAFLVAFFDFMGVRSIRGSRKRRGREAVLDIVEALKNDSDAFITPDGPTGPANVAKKGFYVVADAAGCRVLILRFIPKYYLTIPSWDKFVIPLPFSSVKIETMEFENTKQMSEFATKCGKTPEQIVTDFCNGVIEGN